MKEKNIIYFNQKVTSFNFYSEFLEDLSNFYRDNYSKTAPILSLEYTEFIDPIVLPNIIGTGLRLKEYHKQPIKLLLNYKPKLLFFLEEARFFMIVGKYSGLNIFIFDEIIIGGFDIIPDKHHQEKHIIHRYNPSKNYYELESEEEQLIFRKQLIHFLRDDVLQKDFKPVIGFLNRLDDYEKDLFMDIFSEIVSNSILYSVSESFAMVFANKFKTIISLSDIGIGFHNALKRKKNYRFDFSKKLKDKLKEYYSAELDDFIDIFEVLNYSKNNNRFNLWMLKELVIKKGGTFRIHYNSTQLIFTKRCSYCTKSDDMLACAKCFLDNYDLENLSISPLRIYNHTYKGVHIEIELKNQNSEDYV